MAILKTKKDKNARVEKMKSQIRNNKISFFPLCLRIESGLMKRFKMKAAADERTMTDIITDMMRDYVDE